MWKNKYVFVYSAIQTKKTQEYPINWNLTLVLSSFYSNCCSLTKFYVMAQSDRSKFEDYSVTIKEA